MEPGTIKESWAPTATQWTLAYKAIRSASKGYFPNLPFDFVAATARLIADLN